MTIDWIVALIAFAFLCGVYVGMILRDGRWREKGDHPYMNKMESRGKLYQVKRDGYKL